MISAQQLAKILKQQAAASGEIRVNDALLEITGLDDLIRRDLSRPDGVLILTVDASQIPDSPPNSGFTVGNAAVPAGETKGFLQLDNRLASITFAFGTTIEVTLTLSPQKYSNGAAAPWVLSTSFPELADQAYDQIELADTQLMLATATPQTGLALTSELTVSGVLKAIEDLLG
ncbi:MAG TPA: hypothetical protein VMJ31_03170, partial [Methylocystis sp.]|nr:hypothetical protein [Methylocystis sp.]